MKTKAIIFDFDGTLSICERGSNSWGRVWTALGEEEADEIFYKLYANGRIDYGGWCRIIENYFRQIKVRENVIDGLAEGVVLMPNIKKMLEHMKNNNIKVYVLSGGVGNIIKQVLAPYENYIESIEAFKYVFVDGYFKNFQTPEHDLANKHEFVELLKKKHGWQGEEILFVGNGSNDETIYTTGAVTLCINPDDADYENKQIWKYCIKKSNDLMDVIEYLDK